MISIVIIPNYNTIGNFLKDYYVNPVNTKNLLWKYNNFTMNEKKRL